MYILNENLMLRNAVSQIFMINEKKITVVIPIPEYESQLSVFDSNQCTGHHILGDLIKIHNQPSIKNRNTWTLNSICK